MLDKTKVRSLIKKAIKRFEKSKIAEMYSLRHTRFTDPRVEVWMFGDKLLAHTSGDGRKFFILEREVPESEFSAFSDWLSSLIYKNEGVPQVEGGQLVKKINKEEKL